MSITRSCRLPLALAALALLATPAAAAAKPVVRGTLSRWPTPARNVFGAVTAIDADSGAIVGTVGAPEGRYRLALPTGTYILIGRASDLRRGRARFLTSNVVALGRRSRTVNLPGDPPLKAKRASAGARAAAIGGSGGSLGIGGIPVTTAAGSGLRGGNAIDPLVQGLLPECRRNDEKLIDISKQVTEARTREQRASDDGRTETRLTVDQSQPDRVVTGKVTVDADGKPVVDITITDGKTGAVIDHVRTAGDQGSDVEDVGNLLRRVGRGVGQRDCKPTAPPPAPPAAPAPAPKEPVITPPAAAPTGLVTITYTGSEDVTNTLYGGTVVQTFHADWAESRTATRDGWAIGATPWAFSRLNGTISSIRTPAAGHSCTATLSPPATPDQYYNTTTVFPPALNGTPKTWYVQTGGVPGWGTFPVSSDTDDTSDCSYYRLFFFEPPQALSQPGDAITQQWYDAWAPSVDLPDDPSVALPVNFQHTFTSDCGGTTCTLEVNLQSVITLTKG